jgi:hypothetical protein
LQVRPQTVPMEIPHKEYLIAPSAREDSIGRWMPVVTVRSQPGHRGVSWTWPPQTIVSERLKNRGEAEQRSVEIAKQMIDRGAFHLSQATRLEWPD